MADETPPPFKNPPQPETPEALLHAALKAIDPRERRRLTDEYTDLIVEQFKNKL
jgi:hypothetical protein